MLLSKLTRGLDEAWTDQTGRPDVCIFVVFHLLSCSTDVLLLLVFCHQAGWVREEGGSLPKLLRCTLLGEGELKEV